MAIDFRACSVEGCNGNSHQGAGGRRGYCSRHYWFWKQSREDIPKCSVEGCPRSAYAKGYCSMHWQRWSNYGDPIAGRTPNGDPQRFLDSAVSWFADDCLFWPYSRDNHGYARFYDGSRMQAAHIEVCERVNGPRPTPRHQSAHSCGNGHLGCISPKHLRWATISSNQSDRAVHGTSNRGTRQWLSKLTEQDVIEIRSLVGAHSKTEIARRFGVSRSTIRSILNGQSWNWLS